MPQTPDPLEPVRRLLVATAGGYFRSIRWGAPGVCGYCAGVTDSVTESMCWVCRQTYVQRTDLSDRRGFATYAVDRLQSGVTMYRYKDPGPNAAGRAVMLLGVHAVKKHLGCATDPWYGPVSAWAMVPSLKGRHDHALRLLAPFLAPLPEASLRPAPSPVDPRHLHPENFIADPGSARGRHVLLLEDTWVSGAHVESAAAALKRAGAVCVSTLVLARWLRPDWGITAQFLKSQVMTFDYEPERCPFPPDHVC